MIEKIEEHIKDFLHKCKNEANEFKDASGILNRYFKGEKLTEDELHRLREQMIDSLKIAGIGAYLIPASVIPFGFALLPFIVKIAKKNNINILPSSFDDKKDI